MSKDLSSWDDCNDDLLLATEQLLKVAAPPPKLRGDLRKRVLMAAVEESSQSRSLFSRQLLAVAAIAMAAFCTLFGYYANNASWQLTANKSDPAPVQETQADDLPSTARSDDHWSLVDEYDRKKSHNARVMRSKLWP